MSDHAALLRRAATLARETAQAATEGPWAIWDDLPDHGYTTVGDEQGVLTDERPYTEECNPVAHVYARHDATHITLWHPGIALAVAEWLETEYRNARMMHATALPRHAEAVARALLGEDTR